MKNASKIYKIQIRDMVFSITLDDSYIAENICADESYVAKYSGTHYHAWHEMFIVGHEPMTLYLKDREEHYSNCILFVPPFVEHYSIRNTDYRIMVTYKLMRKNERAARSPLAVIFDKSTPVEFPLMPELFGYAKEIKKHFFSPREYSDEMIESYLRLIFCGVVSQNSMSGHCRNAVKNESYLDKIENILFEYQSDINLATVAEELNLSTKQVSRIIKKNYNSTLSDMICHKRLTTACSLLVNTDMPIADIVEYINFPSESYFYHKFKKTYDMTPMKYRKKNNLSYEGDEDYDEE